MNRSEIDWSPSEFGARAVFPFWPMKFLPQNFPEKESENVLNPLLHGGGDILSFISSPFAPSLLRAHTSFLEKCRKCARSLFFLPFSLVKKRKSFRECGKKLRLRSPAFWPRFAGHKTVGEKCARPLFGNSGRNFCRKNIEGERGNFPFWLARAAKRRTTSFRKSGKRVIALSNVIG